MLYKKKCIFSNEPYKKINKKILIIPSNIKFLWKQTSQTPMIETVKILLIREHLVQDEQNSNRTTDPPRSPKIAASKTEQQGQQFYGSSQEHP